MSNLKPYHFVFTGYICVALKIFNHIAFQILGLFGYLLIGFGLWKIKDSKPSKIAAFSAVGICLLMGFEFVKKPMTEVTNLSFFIALVQVIVYVLLNWTLLYFMFEEITNQLKIKKKHKDANICQQKKTHFMNILFYSVLCQNTAFMFPKIGSILFLVGIVLTIYLSISEVLYMRKILSLV